MAPRSVTRDIISSQWAFPLALNCSRITFSLTAARVPQSVTSTLSCCHVTLAVGMKSTALACPSVSVTRLTPRGPVSLMSRPWMQPENATRGLASESA